MKNTEFQLKITKKEPKENAPSYKLVTIQDIFTHINPENKDRFFKDLGDMIDYFHAVNSLAESFAKSSDKEYVPLVMRDMTWIDD